jgi:hypothetical protein
LLRFAYATRFREDAFRGRLPEDQRSAVVHGEPLATNVLAPPEAGRPLEFTGLVGPFRVRAEIGESTITLGRSSTLRLWLEGRVFVEGFPPPTIAAPGFRVRTGVTLGSSDDSTAGFTYELFPLDLQVREVPRISLAYFDPGPPPRYTTAWTEAIPIHVVADAAAGVEPARVESQHERPPDPLSNPEAARREFAPFIVSFAVLASLAALYLLGRRRRA